MRRAFFLALLLLPAAALAEQSSTNFKILESSMSMGGRGTSASYTVEGTVGEVAHASSSSSSYRMQLGFFSYPLVSEPQANATAADSAVNLSWSASIGILGLDVSGYKYGKAGISGGPYTYTAAGNTLFATASSLTNGTPYYFVVVALDQTGLPVATSSEVTATPVAPTLTFLVDSGAQAFPALVPGNLSATSSILTATTNNQTGFSVSLSRANNAATLALSGEAGVLIPDKTDWIAPPATTSDGAATASSTQPQTLQFRLWKAQTDAANYADSWWGSADTQLAALFAGIPSTTQAIAHRSVSAVSTTTLRVLYNISVSPAQKSGTYQGGVVYTAVANP